MLRDEPELDRVRDVTHTARWLRRAAEAGLAVRALQQEELELEKAIQEIIAQGPVKALETIQFSISTHRGCYGECNFCAIAVHEGHTPQGSPASGCSQLSALARMRAVDVLPVPRGPENR